MPIPPLPPPEKRPLSWAGCALSGEFMIMGVMFGHAAAEKAHLGQIEAVGAAVGIFGAGLLVGAAIVWLVDRVRRPLPSKMPETEKGSME